MAENEIQLPPPLPKPPNGMYPARVDDRGRLKLPTGFQEYFSKLPDTEKSLYVTSLDRCKGYIYTNSQWEAMREHLENFQDDPEAGERVLFTAMDLGSDSAMDNQGRILLSPELRRELSIENQPVRIYSGTDSIEILPQGKYEELRQVSGEKAAADLRIIRMSRRK